MLEPRTFDLPVRWWGDEQAYAFRTLDLALDRAAFVLVDVESLIMVGFSLKSCLYHTCAGAHEHNYRVIVLRDGVCPPGTKEYPDTLDPSNPEGGWMRFVMLRLIETNIGYTSTTAEFRAACAAIQ